MDEGFRDILAGKAAWCLDPRPSVKVTEPQLCSGPPWSSARRASRHASLPDSFCSVPTSSFLVSFTMLQQMCRK